MVFCTELASVISRLLQITSLPDFSQDLAIASSRCWLRAIKISRVVVLAYCCASAAPIPELAPVIRMFLRVFSLLSPAAFMIQASGLAYF